VANVQLCFAAGAATDRDGAEVAETTPTTATAVARMMSDDFMTTPFGWGRRSIDGCGQAALKRQ
jgi:hypothetical protein